MRAKTSILLAGALLAPWLQTASAASLQGVAAGEVQMIRLHTGAFLWATVEDHSAEALTFRRLDNGGLVHLPWSMLEETQSLDLRSHYGYVDLSSDEVLVTAEKLVLADGREVIGLVQGRTDDSILFQTQGRQLQIPKLQVRNHVVGLQVPALDVYTKEDLYLQRQLETDPEDPAAQVELAEYCERILDFVHALEHYQAAQALDPEYKAKELAVILERVQVKVDSLEQVEFLAEVDRLKRRKRFDDALDQLAVFDATYPESPLHTDRLKLEERILEARDDFMRVEVARTWFSWMGRLAAKAGREMTFEQTLTYLEEGFGQDIARGVTETMRKRWRGVEEDAVRQFFIERKLGRWKPASYGAATWLLGEEAALKGGVNESEEAKPMSARDKERAAQAEKINRWLRNQEMAKRARKSEEDQNEIEDFWATLQVTARRNWIIAFYAENAGELEVRPQPELRNCSECGGTGIREVIYTGSARSGDKGGRQQLPCGACHGIGRVRRIRYR